MAFAGGIVAAVAAVLLAVVDQFDAARGKRRIEASEHFSRDGTGFLALHCPYIEVFNGFETITIARTDRRGEGELRSPWLPRARSIQGAAPTWRFRRPGGP